MSSAAAATRPAMTPWLSLATMYDPPPFGYARMTRDSAARGERARRRDVVALVPAEVAARGTDDAHDAIARPLAGLGDAALEARRVVTRVVAHRQCRRRRGDRAR